MLEQRVLLVGRTTAGERPILDGDTGAPLGFARWRTPRCWCRPFARDVLSVHEHEDEPLLFTVRRCWSLLPRREVRDADGHLVGCILGGLVWDRFGRRLAVLRGSHGGGVRVFHGSDQRALAELTATAEGSRLTFSAEVGGEPFVKMLLLAAALV